MWNSEREEWNRGWYVINGAGEVVIDGQMEVEDVV